MWKPEPGGYIQWEEADLVHQDVCSQLAKEFESQANELFVSAGIDYR